MGYKEERITLAGDFRVLDDWRRDADRMTSSIRIEMLISFCAGLHHNCCLKEQVSYLG